MKSEKGKIKKAKVKIKKAKGGSKKAMDKNKIFTFYFLLLPSFALWLGVSAVNLRGQTGGGFDLSHNVIAAGGGRSSDGVLALDGTAGQPSAGAVSTGAGSSLRGGFWAFQSLAPTAAFVSVSGRVLTAEGFGIRNVSVKLTGPGGTLRFAQTGSFGYFRFTDVEAGETYILEVSSRRYTFAVPTRVLSVKDEIADADFIAESP